MQENLAAQYLAKTRKLQCCLEEAEERAETAESALNKVRSRSRAGVSTGGVGRTTSREVSRPLSPLHHRYYSLNSLSPNSTRYLDNNSRLSSYYWLELLYAIPLCFLEVLFSFSCGKSFVIIIRGSSCREILSALPASELRHFQTPLEILTITPDSCAIIDPIVCLSSSVCHTSLSSWCSLFCLLCHVFCDSFRFYQWVVMSRYIIGSTRVSASSIPTELVSNYVKKDFSK